ncbi:MAG: NfeD family protein [Oscillospiraceae bacterium]|nr:NfeD family protein [Oscillospiraceae bacterium]
MTGVWIIAAVAFLIIEGATVGLASVWFAVGALAAMLCSMLGAKLWLQITVFIIVSVAALILTRPLAKKYINGKVIPTNADALIGRECRVTERIDNISGTGAVYVGGKTWTARSADDSIIEIGELVTALRIEGVKLIVNKATETMAEK